MKIAPLASTTMIAALLVTATDVVAQRRNCIDRDGRCMTVQVNGQATVRLSKQRKKELEQIKATASTLTRYEITQTKYELPTLVRGAIDINAGGVRGSESWFGDLRDTDVVVVPLQQVELNARQELVTTPSIRVGGSPVVTQQNVLAGNTLPPGKYLLVVTLRGTSNWDRQVLFVEVAAD